MNDANWTDTHVYRINSRATDNLGIVEVNYSTTTFTFDTTPGNSNITFPVNGGEYNSVTSIDGNASASPAPAVLVQVAISDTTPEPDLYWNGSTWTETAIWLDADDIAPWTYTIDYETATWTDGHQYFIRTRVLDEGCIYL